MIYSMVLKSRENYPNWLFLRHEDLSRNPITEFKTIYKFMGLNFTQRIKEEIQAYSGEHNPKEKKLVRSVHRNSTANIWNWKKRLTPEEIAQIHRATAKISAHFYKDEDW